MILVRFSANYADEFDVDGICILKDKQEFDALTEQWFEETQGCYGIGSNECIYYDALDDFRNDFELTEISEEEAKVLENMGLNWFGFMPLYDIE